MRKRIVAGIVASLLVLGVWFVKAQADTQLNEIEHGKPITYKP